MKRSPLKRGTKPLKRSQLQRVQRTAASHPATVEPGRVAFVCQHCGLVFERFMSQIRLRGGARFCSTRCRQQAAAASRTLQCQQCGAEYVNDKRPTNVSGKFCSRQCWRESFAAKKTSTWVTSVCPMCGREFSRPRAWGKPKFCSRDCAAVGRTRVESMHSRGEGWKAIAAWIRDRDDHRCVRCNAPESGRKHAVDHIVPWVLCKQYENRANHDDNLATLCIACHGVKTSGIEPRLLRGDWLALEEFYGRKRAAAAMRMALV